METTKTKSLSLLAMTLIHRSTFSGKPVMDLKDKDDITSISLRWLFNKSPRMPGTLTMLESIH